MRAGVPRWLSIGLWVIIVAFVLLVVTSPRWLPTLYPLPHQELVTASAEQYGVDPYLVFAIVRVESRFNHNARSYRGATGLMQIMPSTGKWISQQMGLKPYDPSMLTDSRYNIRMGTWYLADLSREFDGRLPLVVAAYNAGRGNVRQWLVKGTWDGSMEHLDAIPFPETRLYVRNVIKTYDIYQAIYKEGRLKSPVRR